MNQELADSMWHFLTYKCSYGTWANVHHDWLYTHQHYRIYDFVREHHPDLWFRFLAWRAATGKQLDT